jgi:hypothetical protein
MQRQASAVENSSEGKVHVTDLRPTMADKKTPRPTPRKRRSTGPDDTPPSADLLEPPIPVEPTTTSTLGKPDQVLLRRTMRFLVNVLEPGLVDRARREGYSREEHTIGWRLWRAAAGETRPFEHWLREQQLAEGIDLDGEEQRRRLQEIDAFENTWFPRTRAIIRRVVSRERRDAFAAAFFKDLVQQPLGPAVVGSVGTYLSRLAGLESSSDPDARVVRATLRSRGLTHGKLAVIERLIEETKTRAKDDEATSPPVSAAELEKARLAQREALESLRDWWNDWGVTLRSRYGLREQLRLGLTLAKRRGPTTGEGGLDDEEDGEPDEDAGRPQTASASMIAS